MRYWWASMYTLGHGMLLPPALLPLLPGSVACMPGIPTPRGTGGTHAPTPHGTGGTHAPTPRGTGGTHAPMCERGPCLPGPHLHCCSCLPPPFLTWHSLTCPLDLPPDLVLPACPAARDDLPPIPTWPAAAGACLPPTTTTCLRSMLLTLGWRSCTWRLS